MGIVTTIKRWLSMLFKDKARTDFGVDVIEFPEMSSVIQKCANIYRGTPYWLDDVESIRTINFAKAICSETARLTTLAIGIKVEGSARADWLQGQIDKVYFLLRKWVEYGCAYGTVFLKPNGESIDVFTPLDVVLVDCDNQDIRGIIFRDSYADGSTYYTRLEYHRFLQMENDDGETAIPYFITNRAYKSTSPDDIGNPVPLEATKWAGLMEDTGPIVGANGTLDGPLFGVFRTPQANNVDMSTPLGLPVYAEAIEELKDLDVAYSRNALEIFDSQKIVLADDRLLMPTGKPLATMNEAQRRHEAEKIGLPHYVKNVFGNDSREFYQEINPQLNTQIRLAGINALLSQIGYKVGFSNGYFVFNQSSGIQTATGVEAEQQRTIQYIKDVRDKLQAALDGTIYALNVIADLYDMTPDGTYEVTYDFGDITYNRDEDRARWWGYVVAGKVPAWYFFQKFEGMSEEEAKAMIAEAEPKEPKLFSDEE